jgi:hypothetical protein
MQPENAVPTYARTMDWGDMACAEGLRGEELGGDLAETYAMVWSEKLLNERVVMLTGRRGVICGICVRISMTSRLTWIGKHPGVQGVPGGKHAHRYQ